MKKKIDIYLIKRCERLEFLLKKSSLSISTDLIHNIRIEVKKLKAVLRLIRKKDTDIASKKIMQNIKDLNGSCRKIRDIQIMKKLLLEYKIKPGSNFKVPPSVIQHFHAMTPIYLKIINKLLKNISNQSPQIKKADCRKYMDARHAKIRQLFKEDLLIEHLHDARKIMKEILFIQDMADIKLKTDKFFKLTEENIGEWHDRQSLMNYLKKRNYTGSIKTIQSENNAVLKQLKKSITIQYS
jgi:CHAD domain-containing protein